MKDVLSQVYFLRFDFVNPYAICCKIIDEDEKMKLRLYDENELFPVP